MQTTKIKTRTSIIQQLPDFPNFTPLTLEMGEEYNNYYAQFPPYTDFSFGNLVIWLNQYGDLRLSVLNENLVFQFTNLFMQNTPMLSFLGINKVDDTVRELLAYQVSAENPPELSLIPEIVRRCITNHSGIKIIEEQDNANYVLDTFKLSKLEGTNYGKIRRQVKKFQAEYANRFEVKAIDIANLDNASLIVNNIHTWDRLYSHNDQEKQESAVINTTLKHAKDLPFKNLSVFIDGRIEAITIYQELPQVGFVTSNHTKANNNYPNLFNFTVHSLAKLLNEQNIPYINFEQDLGIAGLREHKSGLRPVEFLRHYRIELT